ncbi:MAG: prolyl oligopeptidase family serine peptidase [Bacteroidota bacterium]
MKQLLIAILGLIPALVISQPKITIDDYERAVGFMWDNVNNKKAFNLYIRPNWLPDSTGLWFEHHAYDKRQFLKISLPEGDKSELFDHKRLASVLTDSLNEKVDPNAIPLTKVRYKDAKTLELSLDKGQFLLNLEDYSLSIPETVPSKNEFEETSPDKKWIAYTEDYNLFVRNSDSTEIKQLSHKGLKGVEYGTWYGWYDKTEGENGNRPERFYVNWDENSQWLYTSIIDYRNAEKMYMLDWSVDTLYKPRLLGYFRGSPGDTSMVYESPVFYNATTGEERQPGLPRSTHINNASITWSKFGGRAFLYWQSRGYQNVYLYNYDLVKDELQLLYEESSETNIDNFRYYPAEMSGFIFFLSEKSGWRQLYRLDLNTRKVKAITKGEYYVNGVDRIDEKNQKIYFRASGKGKGSNPYLHKLYSVSFDGKDFKSLTDDNLHHQVSISPDGKFFVDNASTANDPTKTTVRSTENGNVIAEMGEANTDGLKNWSPPQLFEVKATDGKTRLYGALWKPTNFDASKSYPIIDHSYTGPHTQMYPKDFWRVISLGNQALAELGFIVMMVDGRGSSGRSKAFHNFSYKNLGGTLGDHVAAIRQLGERYPWIDTTRVGIFGHSAGGYDAGRGMLAYPDFYKVGVSSSADHDHRMEKAWWPEMYMGWPVDSAYHLQSNITNAANLKGRLLITHGALDDNVNASASFKLAEALINADKQFDMVIFPSQRHGYTGKALKYFRKLRWNYFVEHLLGAEPIWEFEWE